MRRANTILKSLLLALLFASFTGCDFIEDTFDKDKEVSGVIESIGDNSLTVDGIEYQVTSKTEYEGITGLADLSVGDEVGIEYKESGGAREAVEIELAGAEDDD
jgi:hypothetical protein